jgi:hypothetical protein
MGVIRKYAYSCGQQRRFGVVIEAWMGSYVTRTRKRDLSQRQRASGIGLYMSLHVNSPTEEPFTSKWRSCAECEGLTGVGGDANARESVERLKRRDVEAVGEPALQLSNACTGKGAMLGVHHGCSLRYVVSTRPSRKTTCIFFYRKTRKRAACTTMAARARVLHLRVVQATVAGGLAGVV